MLKLSLIKEGIKKSIFGAIAKESRQLNMTKRLLLAP